MKRRMNITRYIVLSCRLLANRFNVHAYPKYERAKLCKNLLSSFNTIWFMAAELPDASLTICVAFYNCVKRL